MTCEVFLGQNSDHQKDFSGIVDVDFHRPETPDLDETKTRPIKSLGSCSHIPSRFRSHGRSISREDCNNKVNSFNTLKVYMILGPKFKFVLSFDANFVRLVSSRCKVDVFPFKS